MLNYHAPKLISTIPARRVASVQTSYQGACVGSEATSVSAFSKDKLLQNGAVAQDVNHNATTMFGVLTSAADDTDNRHSHHPPGKRSHNEAFQTQPTAIINQDRSSSTDLISSPVPILETTATDDCLNELMIDHDIAPLYMAYATWAEALEAQDRMRPVYELATDVAATGTSSEQYQPDQCTQDSAAANQPASSMCDISLGTSGTLDDTLSVLCIDAETDRDDTSIILMAHDLETALIGDWVCTTTEDWDDEASLGDTHIEVEWQLL